MRYPRLVGVLVLVVAALTVPPMPPATAASPEWLPLRHASSNIGCTASNPSSGNCSGYHPYWALDIQAAKDARVYPSAPGTVESLQTGQGANCPYPRYTSTRDCPNGAKGNWVILNHGGGIFTYYQHLVSVAVTRGQQVGLDTALGGVGDSGLSTPGFFHLHYEERRGGSGSGNRVEPTDLRACRGSGTVVYPDAAGYDRWNQIPEHTPLPSDPPQDCRRQPAPTPALKWEHVGQAAYSNRSKTIHVDLSQMREGQSAVLVVTARNTGTETWRRDGAQPIRLGTNGPRGRASRFADQSWINHERPAALVEPSAAPGQVGKFEFSIQMLRGVGTFDEHFNLVAENRDWFNDIGLYFRINVLPALPPNLISNGSFERGAADWRRLHQAGR